MRGQCTAPSTLTYLLGDHLGSPSLTFKADPYATTTQLYKPPHSIQSRLWGGAETAQRLAPFPHPFPVRHAADAVHPFAALSACPEPCEGAGFELMDYVARWAVYPEDYRRNPALGRFAQADSLVPGAGNPRAWDRYAGMMNNPVRYIDPSGHCAFDAQGNYDNNYDCAADDFDQMTIAQRRKWLELFVAYSGSGDWFNNIAGILGVFDSAGVPSGSWLSWVDAGILQAIQDGYQLFKGVIASSVVGDAANKWMSFFTEKAQQASATQIDEAALIRLWGEAEMAGTDYGESIANGKGLAPDLNEQAFLLIGDVYRAGNLDDLAGGIGAAIGFIGGGVAGAAACFGLCTAVGAVGGAAGGSAAGSALATNLADPRLQIFGISPVAIPAAWYLTVAPTLIASFSWP